MGIPYLHLHQLVDFLLLSQTDVSSNGVCLLLVDDKSVSMFEPDVIQMARPEDCAYPYACDDDPSP